MIQNKRHIGLLIPSVNTCMEEECPAWAPSSVVLHWNRMPSLTGVPLRESLEHMFEHLVESARLLAMSGVGVIVYGCTSGSFLNGPEWDERIISQIEKTTGIPAVTTSTAVHTALETVGVRRIAIATPYPEDINKRLRRYMEQLGFSVESLEWLQESQGPPGHMRREQAAGARPDVVYALGRRADRPTADALFISCTNFPTAQVIDRLERDLGKPVITSNQATMWLAFRKIGITEPVAGAGRLMSDFMGEAVDRAIV